MIEIPDAARDKIKEMLDKNPGKFLRIVMEGTGCGGPYLAFSLDEANSFEEPVRVNGLDILISEDVRKYAEATEVKVFLNHLGQDLS